VELPWQNYLIHYSSLKCCRRQDVDVLLVATKVEEVVAAVVAAAAAAAVAGDDDGDDDDAGDSVDYENYPLYRRISYA